MQGSCSNANEFQVYLRIWKIFGENEQHFDNERSPIILFRFLQKLGLPPDSLFLTVLKAIRSDEGLTLETSAFNLFMVANLPYQLS